MQVGEQVGEAIQVLNIAHPTLCRYIKDGRLKVTVKGNRSILGESVEENDSQ